MKKNFENWAFCPKSKYNKEWFKYPYLSDKKYYKNILLYMIEY